MNYDGAGNFFYKKKLLKKQIVYRNKKQYYLLLFSDVIVQANKFFIFRYLLNFTRKCIGGQIKVACMVQIWEKTFCQNSDKFGYCFIKNDTIFMCLLCIYKKTHYFKPI